jgi:hypothetical protein
MYVRIHVKCHFRTVIDKTEIHVCRQCSVKIVNVNQQFQENGWNSTCSMQKNRQADGHDKTNSCLRRFLKMKDWTKEIRILKVSYGCYPSLKVRQEYKLTALVKRVMRLNMQYGTGISRLGEWGLSPYEGLYGIKENVDYVYVKEQLY